MLVAKSIACMSKCIHQLLIQIMLNTYVISFYTFQGLATVIGHINITPEAFENMAVLFNNCFLMVFVKKSDLNFEMVKMKGF